MQENRKNIKSIYKHARGQIVQIHEQQMNLVKKALKQEDTSLIKQIKRKMGL